MPAALKAASPLIARFAELPDNLHQSTSSVIGQRLPVTHNHRTFEAAGMRFHLLHLQLRPIMAYGLSCAVAHNAFVIGQRALCVPAGASYH